MDHHYEFQPPIHPPSNPLPLFNVMGCQRLVSRAFWPVLLSSLPMHRLRIRRPLEGIPVCGSGSPSPGAVSFVKDSFKGCFLVLNMQKY